MSTKETLTAKVLRDSSSGSFDSSLDECRRRSFITPRGDNFCIFGKVNVRKLTTIAAATTCGQMAVHFFMLLAGCGVTDFDVFCGVCPIVSGSIALSYLCFALMHNSSISVKPFVIHHLGFLVSSLIFSFVYVCVILQISVIVDFVEMLGPYSRVARILYETRTSVRLLTALLLSCHVAVNLACIQVAHTCKSYLATCLHCTSTDCTEIL